MTNIQKTLYYKSVQFHGTVEQHLQRLASDSLKKLKYAKDRKQAIDPEESTFRFVNYHSPFKGTLVGELLEYSKDDKPLCANLDDNSESYDLSAIELPEGSQFIHSVAYFAIFENHIAVIQGKTLRTKQIEDCFNWLLRTAGKFTEENQFAAFADQPTESATKMIRDTKGISFGSPVQFRTSDERGKKMEVGTKMDFTQASDGKQSSETRKLKIKPMGIAWDTIRKLLPKEISLPDDLDVESVISNRELTVRLELCWNRPRKDDPTTLLDSISQQLRHVDTELDWSIETKHGTISKDSIKCHKDISVGTTDKGFVKREDLWPKMVEWLAELSGSGRILANQTKT